MTIILFDARREKLDDKNLLERAIQDNPLFEFEPSQVFLIKSYCAIVFSCLEYEMSAEIYDPKLTYDEQ